MKLTITINLDNAAFDEDRNGIEQEGSMFETARILERLSGRFAAGSWPMDGDLFDSNGNTVGTVKLED